MKMNVIVKLSLSSLLLVILGCGAGKDKANVELIQDMMDQPNLKSQDFDEYRNQPEVRTPPEGAVARGHTPYPYKGQPAEAEAKLVNPYVNDTSEAFSSRGQEKFRIYCGVCHGVEGHGDGTVASYMQLKPPSLVSDKVKAFKDGRIFHIITDGQGLMSSYATQIYSAQDRWAIVNYVRVLQKK